MLVFFYITLLRTCLHEHYVVMDMLHCLFRTNLVLYGLFMLLFVNMIVWLYVKEYYVLDTLPLHNFHLFDLANCCVMI